MRVVADVKRCIGAGQCVLTAPEVFDQDDDGTVIVLVDEPDAEQSEPVREAVYLCPASTISLEEVAR